MAGFSERTCFKWLKRFRHAAVRIASELALPRSAVGFYLRRAENSEHAAADRLL